MMREFLGRCEMSKDYLAGYTQGVRARLSNPTTDFVRGYARQSYDLWRSAAGRGDVRMSDFAAGQYDASAVGFPRNA